jgi:hypothetical protein
VGDAAPQEKSANPSSASSKDEGPLTVLPTAPPSSVEPLCDELLHPPSWSHHCSANADRVSSAQDCGSGGVQPPEPHAATLSCLPHHSPSLGLAATGDGVLFPAVELSLRSLQAMPTTLAAPPRCRPPGNGSAATTTPISLSEEAGSLRGSGGGSFLNAHAAAIHAARAIVAESQRVEAELAARLATLSGNGKGLRKVSASLAAFPDTEGLAAAGACLRGCRGALGSCSSKSSMAGDEEVRLIRANGAVRPPTAFYVPSDVGCDDAESDVVLSILHDD